MDATKQQSHSASKQNISSQRATEGPASKRRSINDPSINHSINAAVPINHWPKDERPREKLLRRGPQALSDAELLAIFINTGTQQASALDIAKNLLIKHHGLAGIMRLSAEQLQAINGLGSAKSATLKAIAEIASRTQLNQLQRGQALTNVNATKQYLQSQLQHEVIEIFWVLLLDCQHRLIRSQALSRGTVDSAAIYPRELIKLCLDNHASAIIIAHNHPSGMLEASLADKNLTAQLKIALDAIEIHLLDHIIVSDTGCLSFVEKGFL